MSDEVAYSAPSRSPAEQPRHFATILTGIILIIVGAILINQGMNAVQTSNVLILGVGLLAAGALLVFAGASRVWPANLKANIGMILIGILLLVVSGSQLATNLSTALYGIGLTVVGIILIVVGVQVARQGWKRYPKH